MNDERDWSTLIWTYHPLGSARPDTIEAAAAAHGASRLDADLRLDRILGRQHEVLLVARRGFLRRRERLPPDPQLLQLRRVVVLHHQSQRRPVELRPALDAGD